jgi:neutral ceramidase
LDCELFVELGKAIKTSSPFKSTFILTHCNGGSGYLPTARAYREGGYEVDLTGFAPEAADALVGRAAKMLQKLRE